MDQVKGRAHDEVTGVYLKLGGFAQFSSYSCCNASGRGEWHSPADHHPLQKGEHHSLLQPIPTGVDVAGLLNREFA